MMKQANTTGKQRPSVHVHLSAVTGNTQESSNSSNSNQQEEVADTQAERPANVESCGDCPADGRGKKAAFRLACYRCRRVMEFDRGSRFVQCYKCFAINAVLPTRQGRRRRDGVEVLGVICPCCLTTNLVSCRARLVRCNICSTISAAPAYGAPASPAFALSSSPSCSSSPFPRDLFFTPSNPSWSAAK